MGQTPTYRVVSEKGPDHHKWFEVVAMIGDRAFLKGGGRSKKEAEQAAAKESLDKLAKELGLPEDAVAGETLT